jgi:hypothetical protein
MRQKLNIYALILNKWVYRIEIVPLKRVCLTDKQLNYILLQSG